MRKLFETPVIRIMEVQNDVVRTSGVDVDDETGWTGFY